MDVLRSFSSVAVLFFLCFGVPGDAAEVVPGAIPMNSGVFDKILAKFKATLVKFDEAYPYGDKQDAFKEVAQAAISQMDLAVGEVAIQDYGDNVNADLAERYKVKKDDYPVYKLFFQGKPESEHLTYTGDEKDGDAIKTWIVKEGGLWLGLPACLKEFDDFTRKFFKAPAGDDPLPRQIVIKEAEEAATKLTDEKEKRSADIYVKVLSKIVEKGELFLGNEVKRVESLSKGQVSANKKAQLKDRISILTSIQLIQADVESKPKEEL